MGGRGGEGGQGCWSRQGPGQRTGQRPCPSIPTVAHPAHHVPCIPCIRWRAKCEVLRWVKGWSFVSVRGVGSRIRWWQGLYVRVNIGNTSSGERRYLVCEVLGIRDKATEYQVPTPLSVCEVMSKRRALGPVLGARGSCAPCGAGGHSGREGRLGEGRLAVTRGSCDSRVSASVRIPCVAFAPQCPHHSPAHKLLRDAAKGRRLESWRKRLWRASVGAGPDIASARARRSRPVGACLVPLQLIACEFRRQTRIYNRSAHAEPCARRGASDSLMLGVVAPD